MPQEGWRMIELLLKLGADPYEELSDGWSLNAQGAEDEVLDRVLRMFELSNQPQWQVPSDSEGMMILVKAWHNHGNVRCLDGALRRDLDPDAIFDRRRGQEISILRLAYLQGWTSSAALLLKNDANFRFLSPQG